MSAATGYHITSLFVLSRPTSRHEVASAIAQMPGAEVHAVTEEGKLVITLEGAAQRTIIDCIDAINALPGVISASLIYHQFDESEEPCEDLS